MTTPSPAPLTIARNVAGVGLVAQFQPGHGWTLLAGTTADLNATGVGHVVGSQCAWFRGNGNNTVVGTRHLALPSVDLTNSDIGLLLRVDEPNQIASGTALSIYVGNGGFTNFLIFDLVSMSVGKYFPRRANVNADYGGAWTHITIPVDSSGTLPYYMTKSGAQTVAQILANVTDWQIYHKDPLSSTPAKISVQEIYTVPKQTTYPNGVICLTFDDGYSSDLSKVAPIVQAAGGRATSYPIIESVGQTSRITIDQMRSLQNDYGWAVGSHTFAASVHNGNGMTDMTPDAIVADAILDRDWLYTHGFRDYDHGAYPHGNYGIGSAGEGITGNVDVVLAPYQRTSRNLVSMQETIPPADPSKLRVAGVAGPSLSLAQLKAAADVAKRTKSAMVAVFHEIVDVGPLSASQWLTADLQSFVTYAVSLGMPLRTIAEVFGQGSPLTKNYDRNFANMGYQTTQDVRYADTKALTLVSGTITATSSSTAIELGDRVALRLDLVITAASGTSPTIDASVETSPDNVTWTAIAAFAQKTGVSSTHKMFSPCDRWVRVTETVGGTTPSFTRTISGEAV